MPYPQGAEPRIAFVTPENSGQILAEKAEPISAQVRQFRKERQKLSGRRTGLKIFFASSACFARDRL
jgi:hypothetical protein